MSLRKIARMTAGGLLSSVGHEAGPSSARQGRAAFAVAEQMCFSSSTQLRATPKKAKTVQSQAKKRNNPAVAGGNRTRSYGYGERRMRTTPRQEKLNMDKTGMVQQPPSMDNISVFLPEALTEDSVDRIMAWSPRTLSAFEFPDGFGKAKSIARQFEAHQRPHTLVRTKTLELIKLLEEAKGTQTAAPSTLLHAPEGYGASTLLLQAASYALEQSWITIILPRAINFVDSSTTYTYSSALKTYVQPDLTKQIVRSILTVNEPLLRNITIDDGPITLRGGGRIEAGTSLVRVMQLALRESTAAEAVHVIFEVVMRTLVQQRNAPVLLAIDGVQGLYSTTSYRDPDFHPLKSYAIGVPRTLQSCLRTSGPGSFGGIQNGLSLSVFHLGHKSWAVPSEMRQTLQIGPAVDPYEMLDQTMLGILQQTPWRVWDFGDRVLTRTEASALLDIARAQGTIWSPTNDELFINKLAQSGGNIRAFERSLSRITL